MNEMDLIVDSIVDELEKARIDVALAEAYADDINVILEKDGMLNRVTPPYILAALIRCATQSAIEAGSTIDARIT